MDKIRKFIFVKGIVQGVGFRPFVYNLALKNNLKGWVNNTSIGVFIDIEGDKKHIDYFINELKNNPPPLAKINKITIENKESSNFKEFSIRISENKVKASTYISPDYSICNECKEEMLDKNNRRYRYPFTNCTNCGPRFTIIKELPYDRKTTTMNEFKMCSKCQEEYEDPTNRRFHAQPNACQNCGPKVFLVNNNMEKIICNDVIYNAIELLKQGKIFAIKGLGGFNLVCDAKNINTIKLLRCRKKRPNKPLAVMMKDIETVKKYCELSTEEEKIIESNKRPILLLNKIKGCVLPDILSPNNKKIGVMLPYTPMHYLLFEQGIETLVMTSANISGQPMIYTNKDAMGKLSEIVDYYLMHDRYIYMSIDDSVVTNMLDEERVIRAGRGYAPYAISMESKYEILALGSELKNTIALSNKKDIFLSEYIGDLKNLEIVDTLEKALKHFMKTYEITPEVIAYDIHPDFIYRDIKIDKVMGNSKEIKIIEVQHHHSHIVSCMTENGIEDEVIGIAFDGTGYGTDKKIWGGEFLICNKRDFKRVGHLDYFNLPGGESSIKDPWKIAISLLYKSFEEDYEGYIPEVLKQKNYKLIKTIIDKNINSPETSSMGRLFDGISALLGFNEKITFEGEAAIYLENICYEYEDKAYEYRIKESRGKLIFDFVTIIKGIIKDIDDALPKEIIAKKFHNTIIKSTIDITVKIREKYNINTVALSGGVFQNEILFKGIANALIELEFIVITHKSIPCNDSGISLGQLAIANERLKSNKENLKYVYSSSS